MPPPHLPVPSFQRRMATHTQHPRPPPCARACPCGAGCIPVIIADSIELPFEEFLDYRQFTVKIAEVDIPRIKELLLGIPEERVRAMQATLPTIWKHFVYQDCSRRAAALMPRKSGPQPKPHRQGDLVCFQRKQGAHATDDILLGPALTIV